MKYNIIQVDTEKLEALYNNDTPCTSFFEDLNEIFITPELADENKLLQGLHDNGCEQAVADRDSDFIIMFVPMKVLRNHYFYAALAHSKFRKFSNKVRQKYKPKPIIFITPFNIFPNYSLFNKEDKTEDFKERNKDFKKRAKAFKLDKRKYFLDSSIWHYYLPFEDWNKSLQPEDNTYKWNKFEDNLNHILDAIKNNNELKLYQTLVAKEYLEFQTRLMKQSYLENIGGGHHKHIAPFVFHCETEMRIKADRKLKKLKEKYKNSKIKWNVLVVDDYAKTNLKPVKEINISKYEIIRQVLIEDINTITKDDKISSNVFNFDTFATGNKNVLNEVAIKLDNQKIITDLGGIFELEESSVNLTNVIDRINNLTDETIKNNLKNYLINHNLPFENNKEIIEAIKERRQYDIIFLDYLLGETQEGEGERELGSDLFIDPKFKALSKNKGPLGKYWIFPITAFSKAMTDKIKSSGISHIHDDWYLFDGADPISTPQLFRYNLIKLIELQLYQAIVTKENIIKFVLNNMVGDYTNDKSDDFTQKFRLNAKRLYGIFMHRFGIKEALKHDMENGSAFAKSVINYYENNEAFEAQRFYEYTRKLIYLIGYATHQATPQMYNLLNYIVSAIPKFDDDEKNDKVKGFLKAVRKYIDSLTF